MKRILLLLIAGLCRAAGLQAQTEPLQGITDKPENLIAFTHAVLHTDPTHTLSDATLLIEGDKIIAAGQKVDIPTHARIIDCNGRHIYPSFIETSSNYGMPGPQAPPRSGPQYGPQRKGAYYWNDAIKPDMRSGALFQPDDDKAGQLRQYGFGLALAHLHDGIARGTGSVVSLGNARDENLLLRPDATQHFSLLKGVSNQEYPSSLTGTIALLRQFFYDAKWYAAMNGKAETDLSLQAYLQHKQLPLVMKVTDKLDIGRVLRIAKEFGLQFIISGNGDEYQYTEVLQQNQVKLILPIHFPLPYAIGDPLEADRIDLEDLRHWEMAPANPAILEQKGVHFCLTAEGLKQPGEFFRNLRKALQHGLSEAQMLRALTTEPAAWLGLSDKVGTLEKDKLANFLITDHALGEAEFTLLENWVQGKPYVINRQGEIPDIRGTYTLLVAGYEFANGKRLKLEGNKTLPSAKFLYSDTTQLGMDLYLEKSYLTASFYSRGQQGFIRIYATIQPDLSWKGELTTPSGQVMPFTAQRSAPYQEEEKEKKETPPFTPEIWYPNTAYGWKENERNEAKNKKYLVRNATVWTNEKEGILQGYDVAVENGKIKTVGKNLDAKGYTVIDGTGKHLTCGIIDEHSHIALSRGVNEGTESSSAEVRMGDVVNSDDINIYRQLAGGVTMAQLLHGSANAIGGQSAIIKLRWGATPDEMLFEHAAGFIKFALGENVKQSNWGPQYSIRYPQTRMGVEQFFYEMFRQAREYEKQKKESKTPVRHNLELETLLEILHGQRFITCHSYVQSEINMLMHVADSLGFKVNTFTHILEGYKVADKMKEHGANASTFADWWAYKMEVMEAIPYNGTILSKVGVNTAINSDDAEMARRLNQEAAKLVKYGGLSQEEAWKTVTLNPARMLHIDQYVGSIKPGKDADLVLWTANPLSIYARVQTTWVDGIVYFDEQRDELLRQRIATERNRIVQKMLQAKKDGEPTVPINKKQQQLYHCDDLGEGFYYLIQLQP